MQKKKEFCEELRHKILLIMNNDMKLIPSLRRLADLIGINYATLYKFMNGYKTFSYPIFTTVNKWVNNYPIERHNFSKDKNSSEVIH